MERLEIVVGHILVCGHASLGLTPARSAEAVQTTPLVTVAWLKQNLARPDLHVIDASFPQLHAGGHIPGAVDVDLFSYGGREVAPEVMEKRIQSWGVSSDKMVVLYDQGGKHVLSRLKRYLDTIGQPGFGANG